MVCLNAFGGFLSDTPSLDDYVAHIAHTASLIGDAAVGIGADFIDDVLHILDPILGGALADDFPVVPKLESPVDYPQITAGVTSQLGAEAARRIMGENLIRVLSDALAANPSTP